MKKKVSYLLSLAILVGNINIVYASDSSLISTKMSESAYTYLNSNTEGQVNESIEEALPYDTYIDLEETDIKNIETECEDISIQDVQAVQGNEELNEVGISEFDSTSVENIGDASVDEEIVLGEVAIPLYATFNDPASALQNIKNICPTVLGVLGEKYKLDEMSELNWSEYYKYLIEYLDVEDKVDWYDENNSEFIELSSFFDIYENSEKNNQLVSEAADAKELNDLIESDTFIEQLPSFAVEDMVEQNYIPEDIIQSKNVSENKVIPLSLNYVKPNNSGNSSSSLQLIAYSASNATTYAAKYATSANKTKYGELSKDCTNFASQIVVAGGKTANSTWYCMKNIQSSGFSYSSSWCNANSFAKYWGVDFNTHSFKSFSAKLKAGDFITYDKENDGDWDHIGYVTEKKASYSSSLGYTNFKVAQHTKNYHAWTDSSTNGWDTLLSGHPNIRFGYIRI